MSAVPSRTFLPRWRSAPEGNAPVVLALEGLRGLPQRRVGRLAVVIARSRCRLRWFRLSTLPAHERLAALRMQALAWQPFEDSGCALALLGDQGLAVCWDRHAARQALADAGLDESRVQWQPEPLFTTPGEDGIRLLEGVDGVEAQHWQSGQLRSSQWWAAPPDARAWSHFLHAASLGSVELPAPVTAPLRARPWTPVVDPLGSTGNRQTERRVVLACSMALALCFGLAGRQWFGMHMADRQLDERFAGLSQRAEQQAQSRREALDVAQQLRLYDRWLASPLPIEVAEHLRDTLAGTGAVVKTLDLHEQQLRVGLQAGPSVQRAALIRALSAGAWFRDVTEARADDGAGLVVLDIRLDGRRAPAAASFADAAATPGTAGAPTAAPTPAANAAPPAAFPANAQPAGTGNPFATPAPAQAAAPGQVGAPVAAAPRPAAVAPAAPSKPAPGPKQPPATVPDFPPASVFDAIPTQK